MGGAPSRVSADSEEDLGSNKLVTGPLAIIAGNKTDEKTWIFG